jgi:hypothetical protein
MMPFREVPIFINSFNRLSCLQRLLEWLCAAGHRRIFVVDNASTYAPLLDYLDKVDRHAVATVIRLPANAGHQALWASGLLDRLGVTSEYVYTDPDVVPADFCPSDLVGFLQAVVDENPEILVAGLGLRLDDIPDNYPHKAAVMAWERQFWLRPVAPGLFRAGIDTTFALYRPGAGHTGAGRSIRTGWPYLASHEGWYIDHQRPTDEDAHYWGSVKPGTSHWSVPEMPAWLRAAAAEHEAHRPFVVRLDRDGSPCRLPAPSWNEGGIASFHGRPTHLGLGDGVADGFYCDSGLAPFEARPELWGELRRAAKPRARLVIHGAAPPRPHLTWLVDESGPADERLTQATFAGWQLVRVGLAVPEAYRSFAAGDLMGFVRRRPWVVRNMALHLCAIGHSDRLSISTPARRELSFGGLDEWEGFVRIEPVAGAIPVPGRSE